MIPLRILGWSIALQSVLFIILMSFLFLQSDGTYATHESFINDRTEDSFVASSMGDEPLPTLVQEAPSFFQRLEIMHGWLAIFAASALFCSLGMVISKNTGSTPDLREVSPAAWVLSLHFISISFSAVLCLMFIGGFIQGELFPDFEIDSPEMTIASFTKKQFWGKLAVWSFVVGFSEKLVPQLVDNLAHKISPAGKGSQDSASPA